MAVTHDPTLRNQIADFVLGTLNAGTADATGDLVFLDATEAAVATLNLSATAFGAASAGTATANAISDDTNAVGGTITHAALRDRDNAAKIMCSVTANGGGGDIELSSVNINAGDIIKMTALTYTACP